MDRLPQEHIRIKPPELQEMEVGDTRWISSANVDPDGGMWLQKTAETKEQCHAGPVGKRYMWKVERLEEGWSVSIPKSYLPLEANYPAEMLSTIGFPATHIGIYEDEPEEGASS